MNGSPSVYHDDATLLEARAEYFARNGFGDDGGYSRSLVKVKLAGIPFWLPNTAGRKRAVRFHDLHHLVTGYATDNPGEAAISAWELASGCRAIRAAWVLNSMAMAMGLFIAPRATFRAYVRGRHTKNLYARPFDDTLLQTSLGALRTELGLAALPPPPLASDVAWFVFHTTTSLLIGALAISPLLVVFALGLARWMG